jgi:hypothetical protein
MRYNTFLDSKSQSGLDSGFDPIDIPACLFDFQQLLVEWSLRRGRSAVFADCGLGKTPIQLVWADNVVRHTNKPVLILTPLAVSAQTVREGEKFGIECVRSSEGKIPKGARIVVTNYERLHYFDPSDYAGAVCDESSILKNFDGKTKAAVTEFMRTLPYRLLCTATAAPNDYIELGTSSEALGELGFMDMIGRFFKKAETTLSRREELRAGKYRFRGHAEQHFWRWVCSWARAVRKPSDMGCDNGQFVLPPLHTNQHTITARTVRPGWLFDLPAMNLQEQREERRRTLPERCEQVAALVSDTNKPAVCWCHLNDEGDTLERMIPGAVQVSGSDSDEKKEESFCAFQDGDIRVLVTKPKIGGFGLNWQHCSHQTFFPSHSFEQWYQAIRRSWRFGQKNPVTIDVVTSEGEAAVLGNLQRKARAAEIMFGHLVEMMHNELGVKKHNPYTTKEEVPSWL